MLSINQIKPFFPEELHRFPDFMLKEYLQYKILEIIYESSVASRLCFLGGTCLRIVHDNRRFSEDLDFDNLSLTGEQFDQLAGEIEKKLRLQGYETELKLVFKGAWHCYIKFPRLLFNEGISGHKQEKILIQIDTEPQDFSYEPRRHILNRFDVFTTILATPVELLMAQKLYAVLNRTRNKGRDFYDLIFLMSKNVRPDYHYLEAKTGVSNPGELKDALLQKVQSLNMSQMARDVEPFLFNPTDVRKVEQFEALVGQYVF